MDKEKASPQSTPALSAQDEPFMPALLEQLSLSDKTPSNVTE